MYLELSGCSNDEHYHNTFLIEVILLFYNDIVVFIII